MKLIVLSKAMREIIKQTVSILLFVFCVISCNNNKNIIIIDDEDAEEVLFEDVATDINIVPLIADEPIGECKVLLCYGNEILMSDVTGECIYYFVDGKLKSKLKSVGRGRGEYLGIKNFDYSPDTKTLLIAPAGGIDDSENSEGSTTIMKYSVPDMKYIGNITFEGNCMFFARHSEKSIIASVTNGSMEKCRIILVDIENGNITKEICRQSFYSYLQSDAMMTGIKNLNTTFCIPGYTSTIYHCNETDITEQYTFSFGSKNIPKEYLDFDLSSNDYFLSLMRFMSSEDANDCLEGGFMPAVRDSSVSFRYNRALGGFHDHYYKYENGQVFNYYGFHLPGLWIPILPKCVTEKGYATVLSGPIERLRNQETASKLAEEIIDAIKQQSDDNPVILFYTL